MKRILLISHNALSQTSNNGKTLNSIFSGFLRDDLAQIYFNNEVPQSKLFYKFFRLSPFSGFLFIRLLFKKKTHVNNEKGFRRDRKHEYLKKILIIIINKYASVIKRTIRDFLYKSALKNKFLYVFIENFKPDAVFLVAGDSCFSIDVAVSISKKYSIPIFVYVTDDYLLSAEVVGFFSERYRGRLLMRYRDIYKYSSWNFFIGDEMKSRYSDYFDIDGSVLINCNIFNGIRDYSNGKEKDKKTVKFIYAGGLHLGRDEALIELANCLASTCEKLSLQAIIHVFTGGFVSKKMSDADDSGLLSIRGLLPWCLLKDEILSSDFLLHVESFKKEHVAATFLSVSTKIPEYLSSGVCVIGYGPKNIASMKLLIENDVGVVLGCDYESNFSALSALFESTDQKTFISSKAVIFARLNFSPDVIQTRLIKRLNYFE